MVALLNDVFLEDGRGLWVVAVETVEDGIDVLRAIGRIIEGNSHDCFLGEAGGEAGDGRGGRGES